MKKLPFIILALFFSISINSQTVEEVIKYHIEAKGGIEKWQELKSFVMQCNSEMRGAEFPVKITIKQNFGFRFDMQIMGMDCYMVIGPKGGFSFFPIQGQSEPSSMPDDQYKSMKEKMDIQGDFINYEEKGTKFVLEEREKVDDQECYVLNCIRKDASQVKYYINSKTYLVVKEIQKTTVEGEEKDISIKYGDYKNIDGYVLPMSMTNPMGGDMKIEKYIINSDISDNMFIVK